jgi:hypothetical protein
VSVPAPPARHDIAPKPDKDADKPSVGGFLHNLYEGSTTFFGLLPRLLRILYPLETHNDVKLQ